MNLRFFCISCGNVDTGLCFMGKQQTTSFLTVFDTVGWLMGMKLRLMSEKIVDWMKLSGKWNGNYWFIDIKLVEKFDLLGGN